MRSIAFLSMIIVIGVGFACTQLQPRSHQALTCTFTSTVKVLAQSYSPLNTPYTPPTSNIQQNYSIRQQILDDISQAFSNAPSQVQDDLCALSGVFIDLSSCLNGDVNNCQNVTAAFPVSWGYRSSQNIDRGNTYVAIPGSLWIGGSNANAMVLSAYEQIVLNNFVQNSGNSCWVNSSNSRSKNICPGTTYPTPTISRANPDASWATVLAALAHELGHVKFNVTIHPNATYGRNYKFGALQPCSIGTGNIPDFFSGWSYGNNPKKLIPKDLWRQFSNKQSDDNGQPVDHSIPPYLTDFANSSNDPNQLLYTMYTGSNQPWASFWGAWSPDEDFVETYVLYALSANVTNLDIDINGVPYDIISGVSGKSALQKKIQCVANLPVI